MKKNVLIIGSTGFIGKNILEQFYGKDDYKVYLLAKSSSDIAKRYFQCDFIKVFEMDLCDTQLIENVLQQYNIEIIIHLASRLIPSSTKDDFFKEMENVILPTYRLIDYLGKRNIKLIFFSSGGTIYGKTDAENINEKHALQPINYYGYSKLLIENYIQFSHRTHELRYLILRPSNVYGKYQRLEAKQGFISVSIKKILDNFPIEIWGDGSTIRDFIYVEDVAKLTKKFVDLNIENKTVNVGSGKGISLNHIIELLMSILERDIKVKYKDKRDVDIDKMILDTSFLQSLVSFEPTRLEEGIRKFIKSLGDNGAK